MTPCGSLVGVLAVSGFLALGVSAVAGLDTPPAVSLDDYIGAELNGQKLPGLSLAVIKDGEVIKARGYGVANLELSVATTPDSVYEIASLTKQFTATAVVMLASEKKLALDDPVSRFVSELPETWRDVTVRHALDGDKLLPFALRQQLWTPARLNDGRTARFSLPIEVFRGSSYGFGWMTGSLRGRRIVAHGGDISSGFSSYIVRFPDD
jgi:Beta-lactamase